MSLFVALIGLFVRILNGLLSLPLLSTLLYLLVFMAACGLIVRLKNAAGGKR